MTVTPLAELRGQPQTHGRIRIGIKGAKGQPQRIDRFRFTSSDREAIEQIAALYGGTVEPWVDPKANPPEQSQVITTAKEIRVYLPAGAVDTAYELWTGGGCVRRCDGTVCQVVQEAGDDSTMVDVDCLCRAENRLRCKPKTRLSVILPEIRFGGTWRLESTGWTVLREMPGMAAMIVELQARGIVEAVLCLERAQTSGGRRKFVVPRLRLPVSAEALAAGSGALTALHPGALAELPVVTSNGDGEPVERDWFEADDEVVDAELVEEPDPAPASESEPERPRRSTRDRTQTKLVLSVKEAAEIAQVDEELLRHALARKASQGRTSSSTGLEQGERSQVIDWCQSIIGELSRVEIVSVDPPKVLLRERTG